MTGSRPPVALLAAAALVAAAAVTPFVWVARDAVAGGRGAWDRAVDARALELLRSTLVLTGAVTALCVVAGALLAVLVVRCDLPCRRTLLWGLALPLAVPPFVAAIAWADLMSPAGPWARALGWHGFVGLDGAVAVLSLTLFPYAFLVTAAALHVTSPDAEEAARSLGLGPAAALLRVTVPTLRPALGAAALLVALHVLAEFGTPQLMRYETFTTAIFDQLTSLRLDRGAASVLAMMLGGVALLMLTAEWRLRPRGRTDPPTRPAEPLPLGPWRWPAFAAVLAVLAVSAGVPVGWLVWQAVAGAAGPEGFGEGLAGVGGPGPLELVRGSVLVAGGAAAACALLAVPVAVLVTRFRGPLPLGVTWAAHAGYALPGVVVALAVISMVAGPLDALAGSVLVIVAGMTLRYLPEAVQAARSSLARVPAELEQAARSLGHRPVTAFARATLPVAGGGIVAGALLVFLSVIRELPATLLLRPPGFDTLAVRTWVDASEGLYRDAAPTGLVLVGICALALVGVLRLRPGGDPG